LPNRFSSPCLIELIWSFWYEVMGFKQAMNLLSLRYQNRRVPGKDPLSRLELDPLRPLNNLLWGYVQNSSKHLTIARRAAEYMHAYGLPLRGKAIPNMIHADTRKRFLRSFHTLLNLSAEFFRQDDDTTIYADGFPLLNALRELHVILAEGYHNQAQDLTWTARAETMIEQWMLTLPPMRDFLGGRVMVPYAEPWMDRIDTMKKYMGWSEVSASQFHELATFGEQILLSVRFGNWSKINDPVYASNWAKYWRAPLQRYMSNYQSVTGVDLSRPGKVDATPPSDLIARGMRQGLDMAS
jgi:hypothetical protein